MLSVNIFGKYIHRHIQPKKLSHSLECVGLNVMDQVISLNDTLVWGKKVVTFTKQILFE